MKTKSRVLIDDDSKLRITDAAISDSGEYVCKNGPITHTFIVSIEGKSTEHFNNPVCVDFEMVVFVCVLFCGLIKCARSSIERSETSV